MIISAIKPVTYIVPKVEPNWRGNPRRGRTGSGQTAARGDVRLRSGKGGQELLWLNFSLLKEKLAQAMTWK